VLLESKRPTVTAPPPPPRRDDPEALFEEARQHRRERRLRLALVVALVAVAAAGAYAAFAGGTKHSAGESRRQVPVVTASNPTVVLLVDVSGSMRANDIKPTRIQAVRHALRIFVARLPKRSKVALIAFSSNAHVYATPTLNRGVMVAALDKLSPEAGTALGAGLAAAVKLAIDSLDRDGVHRTPGHDLPAAIVLASDGAQNRGALLPRQAADLAKAAGIPVDGVALGTPEGKVTYGYGLEQQAIPVPPDPTTVRLVARMTGGESFVATDASRLDSFYRALGSSIGR
jgi:Ca-activated chloride channel family protein